MQRIVLILFVLLGTADILAVASNGPTPSHAEQSAPQQQQSASKNSNPNISKPIAAPSGITGNPIKTTGQTDNSQHKTFEKPSTDLVIDIITFGLFLVGFSQVLLFWRQLGIMKSGIEGATIAANAATISADAAKKSADFAEKAMVASGRAYVFPINVFALWEKGEDEGVYNWRFQIVWNNHGDTPTKNLSLHMRGELLNSKEDLKKVRDAVYNPDKSEIIHGMLSPKNTLQAGQAPRPPAKALSPDEILSILNGEKIFHLWGWAKYSDIFPNTPPHITKFSWILGIRGDPKSFVPHSTKPAEMLIFNYLMTDDGNCADEECGA